MVGSLSAAVRDAMGHPTPEGRIDSLKGMIANFLESSDPSAQVRNTEYFNHAFAPDLVLAWPGESRTRLVFLRPTPNPQWLAEDLKIIAPGHPIVVALDPTVQTFEPSDASQLSSIARETRALVTDPDAMEEFSSPRAPISSVLTSAVMRGGVGMVDERSAHDVTRSAIEGFAGANNLEAEPTRVALASTEEILDDEQAGRLARLYRAVWEGQGGSAASFPSTRTISGPLTSRDLSLLFTTLSTDDRSFWRRIGRNIRLEQLVGIERLADSASLDNFVEANVDRLAVRGARVFGAFTTRPEGMAARWRIGDKCLILRGDGWSAYFAAVTADLPPYEQRKGPAVAVLMDSVRELGVRLTDVKVKQSEFAISIESVGGANVVDSPDFGQLASREETIAQSAAVALPSGRNLIVEFTTGTATGHTNATFPLDEVGPTVTTLLLELAHDESAELQSRLRVEPDVTGTQPTLW